MVKNYQNNLRKKNSLFYRLVSKAYYKDTKKKNVWYWRQGGRRREGGRGEREKWTSEAEMHMIKKLVYDRNGI